MKPIIRIKSVTKDYKACPECDVELIESFIFGDMSTTRLYRCTCGYRYWE